jgi:hypothetical protein
VDGIGIPASEKPAQWRPSIETPFLIFERKMKDRLAATSPHTTRAREFRRS